MNTRIPSTAEILMCFEKYTKFDNWLPTTTAPAKAFAAAFKKSGNFLKVLENDSGEIIAFLYAEPEQIMHMPFPVYKQMYFCSWESGAKAVKILHNELLQFAEDRGYWMVMSTGSHFDEDNRFAKMLERLCGWERRGYLALQQTAHYSPEKAADGKFHKPRPTGRAGRRLQQRAPQTPS